MDLDSIYSDGEVVVSEGQCIILVLRNVKSRDKTSALWSQLDVLVSNQLDNFGIQVSLQAHKKSDSFVFTVLQSDQ